MTRTELDAHYRRYIASLNERRLSDALLFYAGELLYNGRWMSRAEWLRTAIEDSIIAMPDLQWHIEHLVIDENFVAARLRDTGTFEKEWNEVSPTKRAMQFGENVFYHFSNGQIDEVWSVVDVFALTADEER